MKIEANPGKENPLLSTTQMIAQAKATKGGHLSVGRGGFTLHIGDGHRLSGYGIDEMKRLCIDAGLPVIDSRRVPFNVVAELAVSGPMVAVGAEPRVVLSRAFSYVTLERWAASYRAAGAEIHNIPVVCDEPAS